MSETMSETNGNKLPFCRDSEAAFGIESATRGARQMETNFFFVGIQRRRLAAKVQPEEARFEPELDWGKLWRGQVFGELEAAFGSESTL